MTAALGEAAAGGTAAGMGATRAAGSAGARASRTAGKNAGPKHAKSGQGKRDALQVGDLGAGFLAGKSSGRKASARSGRTGTGRLLVAEFVICSIVLALSPLTAGKEIAPKDWMKKGTAVCGLFVVLGLVGGVGPKTERAMAAFGGLITLALLINQRSIFVTIAEKFNAGAGGAAVGEALAEGDSTEVGPLDGMGGSIVGGALGGLGLR